MSIQSPDRVERRLASLALVFLGVIAALVVAGLAIAQQLPSDPPASTADVVRQFFSPERVAPEPTERAIFLFELLLLPALALAGGWIAPRIAVGNRLAGLGSVVPTVVAVALLVRSFPARRIFGMPATTSLAWIGLALGIAAVVASARGSALDLRRGQLSRLAVALLALLAVFLAFSWRTLNVGSLRDPIRDAIHLDALLYSVSQAAAGKTPILDYPSQYGFFGTLLAPLFSVVGLSVLKFTVTMNVLQCVALLSLMWLMFREIRTAALAVGGCLALLFVTIAWSPVRFGADPYFQYMPLRMLFPAVSVLLYSIWARRPTARMTVAMSLIAGVALIWNIDSGVAVAVSWIGVLGFRAITGALIRRDGALWLKRTAIAAALTATPVLLFVLWVRWRAAAGVPVDFGGAFQYQRLFYGAGYFMMPLPRAPDPWHVIAAVYVFGFVVGTFHALGRIQDERASTIFFTSLVGIGLFAYYQGRSHDYAMMAVVWPAVLIAFLAADWAWCLARDGRLSLRIAGVVAAPVVAFGAFTGLLIARDMPGVVRAMRQNATPQEAAAGIQENIAFLRDATRGKTAAVVLLARFQGVYFAETGLASSVRGPGVVEVVTRAQAADVVREIQRRPGPIFIGVPYLELGAHNPFPAVHPILAERYRPVVRTSTEELRLYVPRP